MWKMFLITQYRSFKGLAYFSKYITGTVFAFVVLIFLIMGFDRFDTHYKKITNQKFVAVKEIDANEFAKIQANLVKHKNIELKKMVELY